MKHTTVALLFGGVSREYEVSGRSAATLLGALRDVGYRVLPIGISRRGDFFLYRGSTDGIRTSVWEASAACTPVWFMPRGGLMTADGRSLRADVVFPALHGQGCEDGHLQGFLDTWGVPYVGCGTQASVLAWNKVLAKQCARQMGIPTLPWVETPREGAEDAILSRLSYPVFLKPVASGSSVGAGRADTKEQLTAMLDNAAAVDDTILAEPCFTGRELEVAILDDGEPIISRVGEVAPNNIFYDYDTKYRADTARTYIPARIPEAQAACVRDYAHRLFTTLGCRHLARVDFLADDTHIYFNEINTLPGFTSISMYPCLMEDSGVPLPMLVKRLVRAALA